MANQSKNNDKEKAENNVFTNHRWMILSVIFVILVYFLLPVLSPFLVAAVLAYMCDPLVDKLSIAGFKQYVFGRTLATAIVMLGLLGLISMLLLIIIPLLQKESLIIFERLPNIINNVRDYAEPLLQRYFGINLAIDSSQVQELLTKNWKTAGSIAGDVLQSAGTNSMVLIGIIANILLLPVVLFYLLRDWDILVAGIGNLIPRHVIGKTTKLAKEIDQMLAEFLRGQFTVMIIMSVFYAAGLLLVGLEMALPIGIIAGLLGFIPYLGPAIGLGLALLVGALHFNNLGQLIPVLMVFGVGQLIESNFITPKLVGDRIGLHPVVVIFALLAGGQLFGFVGVLLALPAAAIIAVLLQHTKDSYLDSETYLK